VASYKVKYCLQNRQSVKVHLIFAASESLSTEKSELSTPPVDEHI